METQTECDRDRGRMGEAIAPKHKGRGRNRSERAELEARWWNRIFARKVLGPEQGNRDGILVYMRSFSVFCIVLHHAICAFDGWPPHSPFSGQAVPSWLWSLCRLTKTWGLSSFAFMAGYCAVFSLERYGRFTFMMRKIDHLLVPCGFWGLVYWWIFPSMMLSDSPVNGTHLWFIPMLFLCFLCLVFTPTRIVPKMASLVLIWGVFAIGYHYLDNHEMFFDYANQSFRPVHEFVLYCPVFVFGFLLATMRMQWRGGRSWVGLASILVASFLASVFPRSFLWYCILQLQMIFWAGVVFILCACLASIKAPAQWIESLDICSFGIYIGHQFFLNAVLILFGGCLLHWSLELILLFCIAFGMPWLVTIGWHLLRKVPQYNCTNC